jgi:hypothetical protein
MVFRDPVPVEYTRLMHLAQRDWEDLLRWLDTSGLALYFFDRLREVGSSASSSFSRAGAPAAKPCG